MRVDAYPQSAEEYATANLVRYERAWRIWRSEGSDGLPAGWCATRRVPSADELAMIVCDSAKELAEALAEQTRRAKERRQVTSRAPSTE
jgi:hypothetical protein